MTALAVASMLVLTGICLYAALNHLLIAYFGSQKSTHLLFAGMCLAVVCLGFSHTLGYQAQTVAAYVTTLKMDLTSALVVFIIFPWFIAAFTSFRPRGVMVGFSLIFALLIVLNLFSPYSLQYPEQPKIEFLTLPWNETITISSGNVGVWFKISTLMVLSCLAWVIYIILKAWRRDHNKTMLAMLFAIGIVFLTATQGILVRAGVLNFMHLGPFGFLLMVVVMSMAVSLNSRQRLIASERRFRSLVEQSPFSIQVLSPNGNTVQVNAAWETLWGVNAEQVTDDLLYKDQHRVAKGLMPYLEQDFDGISSNIKPFVYNLTDNPVRGADSGRERWLRAYIYPIKDADGTLENVILMHEDVTEQKRVEDAIRLIAAGVSVETGELFFDQLVQSLANLFNADCSYIGTIDESDAKRIDSLAIFRQGQVAQPFSFELANTAGASVMGKSICIYPRDVQRLFPQDTFLRDMQAEGYIGAPLFDAQGNALGLIVVLSRKPVESNRQMQEILEIFAARASAEIQRLRAESNIRHMAYQDYLTDLASRAHMYERLTKTLRQVRQSDKSGALILLDLDHFKTINDALGHDVGDEVLRAVAMRLSEAAGKNIFVARIGGDEFVALIESKMLHTEKIEQEARMLAQKFLDKTSQPIFVGERAFNIGASIGVTLFPKDGESELDIMRHAEMALYQAKDLGRGNIQFYHPRLQASVTNRLELEAGLRRAIPNNELELYYQAQIDNDGQMFGAEVLLRWHHPELGNIPPETFIPVAEETGLIHAIGGWVFEQACQHFTEWQRNGVPFTGHLSINVCPWQFARPDFIEQVVEILKTNRMDAHHLMLELTETALLYDIDETIEKLQTLRTLGFKVALDDFGTGYSSLAYLRDLPLDQLKIDKTFVGELSSNNEHPLVESMIAIGKNMKLDVIAEGVETNEQYAKLLELGCGGFQGYLFCRPLIEKDFLNWLTAKKDNHAVDEISSHHRGTL